MNDLVHVIKKAVCQPMQMTHISFMLTKSPRKLKKASIINGTNNMVWEETQQSIKQSSWERPENKLQSYRENTEICITDDFEVLGVTIDDKLKFGKHVAEVCRKVSQQVVVWSVWKSCSPLKQERASILHSSFPISTIAPKPGTSAVKVLVQNWKK